MAAQFECECDPGPEGQHRPYCRAGQMASAKWCIHVIGPDDVLPAASRKDAIRQAHAMNAGTLQMLEVHDEEGIYPTVWAVPTSYEALGLDGGAS